MISHSLEVQGEVITRLKAFPALAALVNGRIYDQPSEVPTFPYVSWGPDQSVEQDADCLISFEMSIQIDAWSRAVGYPEVKEIAEAVREALHDYELPLVENALVSLQHRQTRNLRDPDGLTSHAVIEFTALVEQP